MSNGEKPHHITLADYLQQLGKANQLIVTPELLLDLPPGTKFNTEDWIDEPIFGYECRLAGNREIPEEMLPDRVITYSRSIISPHQLYIVQYHGPILTVYYSRDGAGGEACVGTTDRTFTVLRRAAGRLSAVAFFDPTDNL